MTNGITDLSVLHEVPYSQIKGAWVKVKQEQQPDDLLSLGNPKARETKIREGIIVGRGNGRGTAYDTGEREVQEITIGPAIYLETPENTILEVRTDKDASELLDYQNNE